MHSVSHCDDESYSCFEHTASLQFTRNPNAVDNPYHTDSTKEWAWAIPVLVRTSRHVSLENIASAGTFVTISHGRTEASCYFCNDLKVAFVAEMGLLLSRSEYYAMDLQTTQRVGNYVRRCIDAVHGGEEGRLQKLRASRESRQYLGLPTG